MNDTEAGFLAAVIAEPDSDVPRLVYADWLEERGDLRGEFIRVQCERASLKHDPQRHVVNYRGRLDADYDLIVDNCPACDHRRREQKLLNRDIIDLWQFVPWAPSDWTMTCHADVPAFRVGASEATQNIWHTFRRGFVERIECTGADWLQHGDDITATAPIREVLLATMPQVANGLSGFGLLGRTPLNILDIVDGKSGSITAANSRMMVRLLELEWPGIRFSVPDYGPSPFQGEFVRWQVGRDVQELMGRGLPNYRNIR